MEVLSYSIHRSVSDNGWKPVKAAQNCRGISHLFFADDLLLYGEASISQAQIMEGVLSVFCSESRQKIYLSKSKLFASKKIVLSFLAIFLSQGTLVFIWGFQLFMAGLVLSLMISWLIKLKGS
ncbi:hypothetical protein M9H77_30963 [Catharanthus roseus]|uniref:Uncharacterized protein n=1 Tax=Catharanthus roseus TaxID=4058 RepID=A0ACC0A2N2_CATRO|nr:hypothetical protein M9H77_30963 [Catharanthus roseus]